MSLSPVDESGNPVDWWFMYKVPKLEAAPPNTDAARGFEYAYFDSTTQKMARSPFTLDSDNGALFHTLNALFSNPSPNTGWILYNDEIPDGQTSLTLGHTKGVIGFDTDSNTGFWLLHSWPKFPTPEDTAQPSPMFGQTFLCIALDLDVLRNLAKQMHHYQEPQVYSPRIPVRLPVDDPLRLLMNGISDNDPAGSDILDLKSPGGMAFKVIAKNRNWGEDFWNDLVVDVIDANIDVDTWIRGKNVIPPNTDPSGRFSVEDIKYITLEEVGLPWAWKETKDHAKWAVSEANQGNWVCVGDINRMISQRERGGCTIAFQHNALWDVLSRTDKFVIPAGSGLSEDDAQAMVRQASETAWFDNADKAARAHATTRTQRREPADRRAKEQAPV